jgi:4,5-dihydroxyphthalate decarboxylase
MLCGGYDRNQALIDGTVKPRGIDLQVTVNSENRSRQASARERTHDAVEFYTCTYIADLPYRQLGYTAIPIFVKRMFRHSYIYVNKKSGIRTPKDLEGKRVGQQTWVTSTAVWARGILADDFGVDLSTITWFADRPSVVGDWKLPEPFHEERVPQGKSTEQMLFSGELDAAITTELWAPNVHPDVDFLFPNYAELEREYYKRTGFFPIMHTLLIKTEILEKEPWVAMSMFNAWMESKQKCYEWLEWQRVHQTGLFYRALWEEERALGGPDYYVWGFKKSRAELAKMIEMCEKQGMLPSGYTPEDMFHPSTLDT